MQQQMGFYLHIPNKVSGSPGFVNLPKVKRTHAEGRRGTDIEGLKLVNDIAVIWTK